MTRQLLLSLALLLGFCTCVCAQSNEPLALHLATFDHQQTAMKILGGYALVNIAGGLALRSSTTGSTRRFHEMNALWNVVNLSIAGVGYFASLKTDPSAWSLVEGMRENNNFARILLFNTGLDVGYIMGGLYLRERANRPGADADQLRGYGAAILLQGGFLFAFDLVNYLIANGRGKELEMLIGATENGLGLTWSF